MSADAIATLGIWLVIGAMVGLPIIQMIIDHRERMAELNTRGRRGRE